MEINVDRVSHIIENNELDNVICRALELRPEELAKYICGLANGSGGFIILGVEKQNGRLKKVGCQKTFDVAGVIKAAGAKIPGGISMCYGFVLVGGIDVFAVEVAPKEAPVLLEGKYYVYENNGVQEKRIGRENGAVTLFISYTECDKPIVDIIERKIKERLTDKVKISRYEELQYKDSFKAFMNTIQDHDFVLTVVSDTYLKSQACMYEVGEIIKDHHYKDRLLFVVLSENERKYYGKDAPEKIGPDIYKGAEKRLEYVDYWKKRYESLENKMHEIGDFEAVGKVTEELKVLGQIYRRDIAEFLEFLADENGKNFEKLNSNDFNEVIAWLEIG